MDSVLVTAADFNEDKYKLLQLNPEIERAVTTGSKYVHLFVCLLVLLAALIAERE